MIEEKFKSAIAKMYPTNPPDAQALNVMRHVFFAGWGECLYTIEMEIPAVNITEGVMMANTMKAELQRFWGAPPKEKKIIIEP